jgi:hypothetical protein
MGARMLADREVIPQAMKLNPPFFKLIYSDLLNSKKTRKAVEAALEAVDDYVAQRVPTLFGPVLEHLEEGGRGAICHRDRGSLQTQFRHRGRDHCLRISCRPGTYRQSLNPVQLTKASNIQVQELAFVHLGEEPDEF